MTAPADVIEHVWWTPREVAEFSRRSLTTVHRHLAAGTLRSRQNCPNGRRYVHRDWAEQWTDDSPPLPIPITRKRRARR